MDAFVAYSLPIQGLKSGVHHFKFEVDHAFFAQFEDSPVQEGKVHFELELDKRPDLMRFNFTLEGFIKAECDRCTATIDLPIEDERQLIVKFGEEDIEVDDEVIFLQRDAPVFNVAKYLYEFIVLALPITNTYDCENDEKPPCNFEVLKHLKSDADENQSSSIWDSLRDLNKDN
ncbi:MAG: YceD family protein [Saprospiraceae bacterium]